MSKKRAFPSDWSDMTDDQVLENIKYLEKNYKRYSVSEPDDYITIIGNVKIQSVTRRISDFEKSYYECFYDVNGKSVARETEIGNYISTLRHKVFLFDRPFRQKVKDFWQDNHEIIIRVPAGVALLCLFGFAMGKLDTYWAKKQEIKQEKFKQEIIKEALEQFRQEQQQDTILYQPKRQK